MFSNREKAKEARREVGWRNYVYQQRIDTGKMKAGRAEHLIKMMTEIAEDYEKLADRDELEERLL